MKTKYYKQTKYNEINYQAIANNFIVAIEKDMIVGGLDFEETDEIIVQRVIDNGRNDAFRHLFSKLLLINYLNKDIILDDEIYKKYSDELSNFSQIIIDNKVYLSLKGFQKRRYVKFGNIKTGCKNNICDVKGVMVGHSSINEKDIHTGITAIFPHKGNMFEEKVIGSAFVYNGFGKSIGLTQIAELGTIETPILLTNTLNVGKVADGLVEYVLEDNPEIGITTGTLNPIVMECNDGTLNNIRSRVLNKSNVYEAIRNAKDDFIQGNIGAGSGMICHGFKGGIGSASRVINLEGNEFTIGVLVNSNFLGSSSKYLIINNRYLGDKFIDGFEKADQGSIIIVVATDIPLSERQLKRVLKRAVLGIGKTGAVVGNGSGDIVIGFSTANIIHHYNKGSFINLKILNDNAIDQVFRATVDASEEAIINSLLYAKTTKGIRGYVSKSIMENVDVFDDLFIENIFVKKD